MNQSIKTFLFLLSVILLGCKNNTQPIDLNELTISEIHKAFEEGTFTSEELVIAYFERIKEEDSLINSITYLHFNAIEDARKLDHEFAVSGKLRPLHGIPLVVKDNINTIGLPTTAGSRALLEYYPESDAPIIEKLKEAGAIIFAKSNMAEWAFSPRHTKSTTAGTTRNPYNHEHVPAGSSGGTGAAIASNFGAVGLGTDTGNSIRGPSSHNALVGFRTTLGLISRSGIVPLYLRNDVVGPMCRTVEDATRVMEVMAGYDPSDPITEYGTDKVKTDYQQYLKKDGLNGARIGVLRILSENEPDQEISALFNQALKDMDSLGAIIVDPVDIPEFDSLRQNQWCAIFREDLEKFLADYVKNDTIQTIEDVVRIGTDSEYAKNGLEYFLEATGRGVNPEITCGDPYTDVRRIAFRKAIESVMDSLELDALVYPSWNNPPARIDFFNEEYKGDNSQIISPHTGQPAFTVPMGFNNKNLPAGLQFLGRMFDEPTLVQLTYAYEQGTCHRKSP